jgi:hypothetical protein
MIKDKDPKPLPSQKQSLEESGKILIKEEFLSPEIQCF